MAPFVSVVIPVYNEERFIKAFLDSVYQQDYPQERLEIIVVDGHSSDRTVDIINENFPEVRVIDNPKKIVPISMNMGIRVAKGEYIIRLDAHCTYPQDYFSRLIHYITTLPNADNVGGVCRTLPANDSAEAKAIAIALSSKFGIGNSEFRVGTNTIKEVDTVPFGCYRREIFEKIGGYDEELIRNQDNELNSRLKIAGGTIYLIPDLPIDYYARDSVKKCAKMFYQYGLFNPLVDKKLKHVTSLRRMVPLFFVLYLVALIVFGVICPHLIAWFAIPLFIYIILDILFSLKEFSHPKVALWLLVIYPVMHVNYGMGYLDGFFRIITKRPFSANSNH